MHGVRTKFNLAKLGLMKIQERFGSKLLSGLIPDVNDGLRTASPKKPYSKWREAGLLQQFKT